MNLKKDKEDLQTWRALGLACSSPEIQGAPELSGGWQNWKQDLR